MAREPVSAASSLTSALRTFRRPWPIVLAGLGSTVIGLLLSGTPFVPARVIFLLAGVLIAAIAVERRLQTSSWQLEDRAESAGLLALAAFVSLLAFLGMDESWDSGGLFFGALTGVALVGSFLVLLPKVGRRIAASILVVLHFSGILMAITAVPPRNDPAPWLSMQAWTHGYRHYLTFMYLTNAYHFYSPDPGPPTLLWFYVKYEDGTYRWIKLPNKSESPVLLHHQRQLAAAESTNNPGGIPLLAEVIPAYEQKFGRKYEILPGVPHDSWEVILRRRHTGADLPYVELTKVDDEGRPWPAPIQLVRDETEILQYSEPQEFARRLIASFARHIARTSPNPEHPNVGVKYVRVYRVTHNLLSPRELSEGNLPTDEVYYTPIYMGKYDIDGKLLDPKDPFLFWYLPIMKVPERYPKAGTALYAHVAQTGPLRILDCVKIHANESDKVQREE